MRCFEATDVLGTFGLIIDDIKSRLKTAWFQTEKCLSSDLAFCSETSNLDSLSSV